MMESIMIKILFVFVCIGIAAMAVVKVGAVSTAGTSQARTPSALVDTAPSIDPAALMRNEPHDLPLETWNPI
jgi:hypothetical protein